MRIRRDQFEAYEQMYLSGQIEHGEFQALLRQNAAFRAWYVPRAEKRTME